MDETVTCAEIQLDTSSEFFCIGRMACRISGIGICECNQITNDLSIEYVIDTIEFIDM